MLKIKTMTKTETWTGAETKGEFLTLLTMIDAQIWTFMKGIDSIIILHIALLSRLFLSKLFEGSSMLTITHKVPEDGVLALIFIFISATCIDNYGAVYK